MTQQINSGMRQTAMDTAKLLLAQVGLTPDDLLQVAEPRPEAPTFRDFVPIVKDAVQPGSRRTYGSYWDRVVEHWGDKRLNEISPSDIRRLLQNLKAQRVQRRNGREGRSTGEHFIGALRCLYKLAVADGYLREDENPAMKVAKPARLPSTRSALRDDRLEQIANLAATTGNDPALDALIIRIHSETACRTGGALSLRPRDLDPEECTVLLREKGETQRRQPVSPTLMAHLLAHAEERGAATDPYSQLLRYKNGEPITDRRYNYIWKRLGDTLPWVRNDNVSAHWIRHTILTWVQRRFGEAVAERYAGHKAESSGGRTISTYTKADITEVAAATAALTGEDHPLAPTHTP